MDIIAEIMRLPGIFKKDEKTYCLTFQRTAFAGIMLSYRGSAPGDIGTEDVFNRREIFNDTQLLSAYIACKGWLDEQGVELRKSYPDIHTGNIVTNN